MNINQSKGISIKTVFESFSLFPRKVNSKTAFYFAIDREEKTPSLSVDFVKNTAFDFGTGKKYDVVSLVQAIKKCSVSESLEYLSRFNFSLPKQKEIFHQVKNKIEIIEIKGVQHPALIDYLKLRKVETQSNYLKEIHYQISNKKYFGVGFKNDSDGYEVRSKYSKICLGKKDITLIKNESETLRIFEGFFDFLSYKNLEVFLEKKVSDYLILNSISMLQKTKNLIQNYAEIELYFDNDNAGDLATLELKKEFKNVEDCRVLYKNYKDLNDFLTQSKNI